MRCLHRGSFAFRSNLSIIALPTLQQSFGGIGILQMLVLLHTPALAVWGARVDSW